MESHSVDKWEKLPLSSNTREQSIPLLAPYDCHTQIQFNFIYLSHSITHVTYLVQFHSTCLISHQSYQQYEFLTNTSSKVPHSPTHSLSTILQPDTLIMMITFIAKYLSHGYKSIDIETFVIGPLDQYHSSHCSPIQLIVPTEKERHSGNMIFFTNCSLNNLFSTQPVALQCN